jgi:hypothetical protein
VEARKERACLGVWGRPAWQASALNLQMYLSLNGATGERCRERCWGWDRRVEIGSSTHLPEAEPGLDEIYLVGAPHTGAVNPDTGRDMNLKTAFAGLKLVHPVDPHLGFQIRASTQVGGISESVQGVINAPTPPYRGTLWNWVSRF